MKNEKKVDTQKETHLKQTIDTNKGPILFGFGYPHKPKEYICPSCGKITAADVLWKVKDDADKPFCGVCKEPVLLSSTR